MTEPADVHVRNDPALVRDCYGRVADRYAEAFLDELSRKPLDRALLDTFAVDVRSRRGCVADLGCGPGQVACYLRDRGVEVVGIDLSPPMIERARASHPGLEARVGDMMALEFAEGSLAGATAFYAIVHLVPEQLHAAFREWRRVLAPGAPE